MIGPDEVVKGQWRLHDDIEPILRRMGERGDIIRTMQREVTARLPERSPADYAIYDPGEGKAEPIVGRLVSRGLSDEHADRLRRLTSDADPLIAQRARATLSRLSKATR